MNGRIKTLFKELLWFLEGIIVGFGAIMPGLSGGTLCVAFGMYLPLIRVISHPKENVIRYGKMLTVFAIGVAVGFIGLSGLSSSTLLLFFGLYQPMLDGISCFDMGVIIPLAIGIVMCVLLLSKAVSVLYKKHYGAISHTIIGVVIATVVMLLPDWNTIGFRQIICIVCGALVSYAFTRICARMKK